MATPASLELDRPLRVGEVLASSVRVFGTRPWPFIGLGGVEALAFLAASAVHWVPAVAILSATFAFSFGFAARIVAGDELALAARRVAEAAPVLLALAFVVALPFYLGFVLGLLLLIFAAGWLGLTAFAIPAAMLEPASAPGRLGRVTYALGRTRALAAAEYVHAVAVSAVLLLIYVLVSVALAAALASYADNGRLAAQALAQVVLAPFFFIGLTVLYFDQRARAIESIGKPGKRG